MNSGIWSSAAELKSCGTPFVMVTMVSTRGSAPQEPGAKAIVTSQGLHCGTVGGGKVELRCIAQAQAMLESGRRNPELMVWNLQRDIGMTCGGEVTYLFEPQDGGRWEITLFGAGHVAQAVVRALEPIDCQVICIDSRPEWLEKLPRTPKVRALRMENPADHVGSLSRDSFVLVMTQGHATDLPILHALMSRHPELPFLGSVGSDVKALKLRSDLKERGIPAEVAERLRCPVGLPLGSNQPAEIAISIVAQLLQVRAPWSP